MNLNNNWIKYLDQQSGYFYYYNDTTNESKWEEMITTYDKISTGICDDNINGGNIKTSSVEYSILENTSMKKEKSTDLIDLMSEPEKEQLLREPIITGNMVTEEGQSNGVSQEYCMELR